METIKIAHLYYDLMNLYGEHGNIRALSHHFEEHKVKVIVHNLTVDDRISFPDYDLFYIGSGSQEAFQIVLEDLLKRKEEIHEALEQGKFFFATGNALNLFGTCYYRTNDTVEKTLGLLDFESQEVDFRIVGEQVYKRKNLKQEMIGFQNRNTVLKNVQEKNLFEVQIGTGYAPNKKEEGIHKKNFYGTYLLGPVFIRNPYFTESIMKEVLKQKKIEYQPFIDKFEIKAYHEYQKNILKELED